MDARRTLEMIEAKSDGDEPTSDRLSSTAPVANDLNGLQDRRDSKMNAHRDLNDINLHKSKAIDRSNLYLILAPRDYAALKIHLQLKSRECVATSQPCLFI